MATLDCGLALILSGGNALGAYQGGAYQALHERGLEPDWVAAASAGAMNGAIICGNAPEDRLSRLREFWGCGEAIGQSRAPSDMETMRRSWAVAMTCLQGQPGLFIPRHLYGPWWNPLGNDEPSSLYDLRPLEDTLRRLVDFDRLHVGAPRFSITAVDIDKGEDVAFDTRKHRLGVEHLRASGALLPAFSPVEIDGRLLGDAGVSINLPVDAVLAEPWDGPLLCIAIDLLPLAAPRPRTLGDTISRMQDLLFATQSRRALAAWQAVFDARQSQDSRSVTLLHVAYADQGQEVAGKAFDFSARSGQGRWEAGYEDVGRLIDGLLAGRIETGRPGLTVYRCSGETIETVRWSMGPAGA